MTNAPPYLVPSLKYQMTGLQKFVRTISNHCLPSAILLLTFGTWFTLIAYYSTILSHLDRGEEDAKLSILECARVR